MKTSKITGITSSYPASDLEVRNFLKNRAILHFQSLAGYTPKVLDEFVVYAVHVDQHIYTRWHNIQWMQVVVFFADDEKWILRNDEDYHEVLIVEYDALDDIPF